MLSYQHGYHAGNFADVIKHLILTRILAYTVKKDKPLLYLETHSGRGIYDLKNIQSTKTREFEEGIGLLWKHRELAPDFFKPYLDLIRALNLDAYLRYYPGSPSIAISSLRPMDRLVFAEKHPTEFSHLENLSRKDKRVFFSHSDGIEDLSKLLPPIERRGLIFLDPSYEIKDEYKDIPRAILQAHTRFETGIYAVWYPIIDNFRHKKLVAGMQHIQSTNMLQVEFYLHDKIQEGMRGCGLWIVNPPFVLEEEIKVCLQFLRTIFNKGQSHFVLNKTFSRG